MNEVTVFYLKYFFLTSISDSSTNLSTHNSHTSWTQKNAYAILFMIYHSGSFIGKSSLPYIKLSKIEIPTILMSILIVLYAPSAYSSFISIWVQCIVLFCVGVISGISYCNSFYMLMRNEDLRPECKELMFSVNSFFKDLCIFSAAMSAIAVPKSHRINLHHGK